MEKEMEKREKRKKDTDHSCAHLPPPISLGGGGGRDQQRDRQTDRGQTGDSQRPELRKRDRQISRQCKKKRQTSGDRETNLESGLGHRVTSLGEQCPGEEMGESLRAKEGHMRAVTVGLRNKQQARKRAQCLAHMIQAHWGKG